MKNIEKYIIVILSFIALGAIGTAVYFGVNNKHLKEQDTIVEVDKQETNKKEDLNDENIDTDDKVYFEGVEVTGTIYEKNKISNFDKSRFVLGLEFGNKYYFNHDKVMISKLDTEAKVLLILNQVDILDNCGYETYCSMPKSVYDNIYINVFGETPKVLNFDGVVDFKYDETTKEFYFKTLYDEIDCGRFGEYVISQNTYEDRIEYTTLVSYFDGCEEQKKLCGDECITINPLDADYSVDYFEKETIKNQDKFDKYKYTFKYSEEYNTYYFYSVEKVK